MNQVAQVIMFLVCLSDLFMLIMAIFACQKQCQSRKRRNKNPPELSSDEEDDAEFIR